MPECPRCERCFEDDAVLCPDDQAKTKITLPGTNALEWALPPREASRRGAMARCIWRAIEKPDHAARRGENNSP